MSQEPSSATGAASPRRRMLQAAVVVCIIGVAAAFVVAYLVHQPNYEKELRLVFLFHDALPSKTVEDRLATELQFLRGPAIPLALAQGISRPPSAGPEKPAPVPAVAPDRPKRMRLSSGSVQSPAEFSKWFTESFSTQVQVSEGKATVRLLVKGDSPDLLDDVLESYASEYIASRRTLDPDEPVTKPAPSAPARERSPVQVQPAALSPEIARARLISEEVSVLQRKQLDYQTALDSIDHGKGHFRGFTPYAGTREVSSVVAFENRIARLVIERQNLATKFTENAPELRVVDEEINALRRDLRQLLSELQRFSRAISDDLRRQMAALEEAAAKKPTVVKTEPDAVQRPEPQAPPEKQPLPRLACKGASLETSNFCMFVEGPFLVKKPFWVMR